MEYGAISLLKKRTFLPLFLTQFFGAFNDNAFKLSMLTLISYHLSLSQTSSEHYQAWAAALFILPFFLFSATAGQLADKYDKAKLTLMIKLFELGLMLLGGWALIQGSIPLMLTVLMGMGTHSTFFGPIKYAILPDHLPHEALLKATGLLEASTFIAILLGTTLGALAIGTHHSHVGYAVALTISAALAGLGASFFIPPAIAVATNIEIDWRFWTVTLTMLRDTFKNKTIRPAILTISWFWLLGAIIMMKLPDYMHYVLRADTNVFALFLTLFSIGIAFGSLAISYWLAGRITLHYVPIAMLFLSFFIIDLYGATPIADNSLPLQSISQFLSLGVNLRIALDFFLFSFCGGLFIVPLYTFIQVNGEEQARARTIAANNIVNALAMVLGSVLVMAMLHWNTSIALVFLVLALVNIVVALALKIGFL